jgi:Methylamine utilisation protein MauE
MSVLAGPFAIACVLLAIGGALKAAHPLETANALRAMRLPSASWLVRTGGAVEAIVAIGALVTGWWISALLVAASYLAFALFVIEVRRAGKPLSSCGCFGKVDTPPTMVHIAIDLAAAAVAAAVAFTDVALPAVLADQPLAGVPFVLLMLIGSYLVFLAFTALPKTMAAAREARHE